LSPSLKIIWDLLNFRVVDIASIFSRYSSESPEKRGMVLSFLILFNSPVIL